MHLPVCMPLVASVLNTVLTVAGLFESATVNWAKQNSVALKNILNNLQFQNFGSVEESLSSGNLIPTTMTDLPVEIAQLTKSFREFRTEQTEQFTIAC